MQVAINRGPHILAMVHKAMIQLDNEVADKFAQGKCQLLKRDDIKDKPPKAKAAQNLPASNGPA